MDDSGRTFRAGFPFCGEASTDWRRIKAGWGEGRCLGFPGQNGDCADSRTTTVEGFQK